MRPPTARSLLAALALATTLGPAHAATTPEAALRIREGGEWRVAFDPATGRPRALSGGAAPLLDAASADLPDDDLRARALAAGTAFVRANASLLNVDPDALRPAAPPVVASGGHLVHVLLENAPSGVPVLGSRVTISISHGNAIHVALAGTEPVAESAEPAVGAAAALDTALQAARLDVTALAVDPIPQLVFVREDARHRLCWRVVMIASGPPQRIVALVDAGAGALVSLTDETVQACGPPPPAAWKRVTGGVRPERADEAERQELLAFVDVSGAVSGPDGYFLPGAGSAAALTGPFISIDCQDCRTPPDPAAAQGPDGHVDFGTGGRDADGSGASTPADRSAWFHVEGARRHAASWLSLPWLQRRLPVHTNLPSQCNAYWDGNGLNFFVSSPRCANTGEIRDVMAHEWGHGLDDNDGIDPSPLAVDAATGEAVADIAAMIRGRDACMGESFFSAPSDWPSAGCSGVRDLDELAPGHEHGTPATMSLANVASLCGRSAYYRGPAGYEGHCEGEILGQAFWHLVRNLVTGTSQATGAPLPDGPLPEDAAWEVAESLFFGSRAVVASYAPSSIQSIGLSAYDGFLLADDEGDGLANGTPHAAAIHDAFAHHGIAESPTAPPDAPDCAAPADPVLTLTSSADPSTGLPAIAIAWTDTGAARYRVTRSDAPGEVASPLVAVPGATTSLVDRGVLVGRTYTYRVVAESAQGCRSRGANARAASPGVSLRVTALRVVDAAPANGNGLLEEGESADLFVAVTNDGAAPATSVVVTLVSQEPGLVVLSGGPVAYGTIAGGATVTSPVPFRVQASAGVARFAALVTTMDAAEGCFRSDDALELAVPDLHAASQVARDLSGDLDGTWEPGESASLTVALGNAGLADARSVTGVIAFAGAPPAGVSITQAAGTWPDVPSGSASTSPLTVFGLSATSAARSGSVVSLLLDLSIGGVAHRSIPVEVVVGAFPGGFLEWSHARVGFRFHTTPLVLQLTDDDGDGAVTECDIPDVVAGGNALTVAMSGADGTELWTYPRCVVYDGAIAGGDIDDDGLNEVVFVNGSVLYALSSTGTLKWQLPVTTPEINAPSIADIDADGTPEVITGFTVVNGEDGTVQWSSPAGSTGRVLVGDLDLDGRMEIIGGNGTTSTTLRSDGSPYPVTFPGFYQNGGLVNLDDDPQPEVVLLARSPWTVRAYDHDGTPLWSQSPGSGVTSSRTPTFCLGNFDGDDRAEVAFPKRTTMYGIDDDGTIAWSAPTDEGSCCAGCSVFDFDGDGIQEIVYRDEDYLSIFDSTNGRVLWRTPVTHSTGKELPAVADIDRDGSAEIVVSDAGSLTGYALRAFGNPAWPPARGVWNQEDYSVTGVTDRGGIVTNPAPRWLSGNDWRGQESSCSCVNLALSFTHDVPDCGQTTACFAASVARTVGASVTWDFGDGSPVVTGDTPCHSFPGPGDWLVTARAADDAGCPVERSELLHVGGGFTVDFAANAFCKAWDACVDAVTTGGVPPFEFSWDFGDGSPLQAGPRACRSLSPGPHSITCFARDAEGCLSQVTRDVESVDDPSDLPELSPRGAALPVRVTRADASSVRVTWDNPNIEANLYQGDIVPLRVTGYSHGSVGACTLIGAQADLAMPSGDRYFLVVSRCPAVIGEGPYGFDSFGAPRPAAGTACP